MSNETDQEKIYQDWFAEWASEPPIYGWASELLTESIESASDIAWGLILSLVDRAPHDDALGWIGAGPMEDLLSRHGSVFIDRVEVLARSNARFLRCLGEVWGDNRIEPSVYARLRLAAPVLRT